MTNAGLENAIVGWLAGQTRPVSVWAIRDGVGSEAAETFRALAVLVVRGDVERDGATFRLVGAPDREPVREGVAQPIA